jgi:hypothetical protein
MEGPGSFLSAGEIAKADGTFADVLPGLHTPLSLAPDFSRFATIVGVAGPQAWAVAIDDLATGDGYSVAAASMTAWPVWSPQGNRIAFSAPDGAPSVIDADGSNLRELVAPATPASALWWSPDGTELAATLGAAATGKELWILPANGSRGYRLFSGRDGYTVGWSPDSQRLAVIAGSSDSAPAALYVASRDGSNLDRLATDVIGTTDLGGSPASGPSWSPGGLRISYTGFLGVTVYDFETKLGTVIGSGYDPAWSPDGGTIAYADWSGCDRSGIVVSRPDGTSWRKLTSDCRIFGTSRNDDLAGTDMTDQIYGEAGNDALDGSWGDDTLYGGPGNDRIVGGSGVDVAYGGPGNDTIEANDIYGGSGRDRLSVAGDWPAYIYAIDGERDVVSCGRSRRDIVYADRIDRVGKSCERVFRR